MKSKHPKSKNKALFVRWKAIQALTHYSIMVDEIQEAGKDRWKNAGFVPVKNPEDNGANPER